MYFWILPDACGLRLCVRTRFRKALCRTCPVVGRRINKVVHAFTRRILMPLSVDKTQLPRYVNLRTNIFGKNSEIPSPPCYGLIVSLMFFYTVALA